MHIRATAAAAFAIICLLASAPAQALATDAEDRAPIDAPSGTSPDADPEAAPSVEDAGPPSDYSDLPDAHYGWVAELDGSERVSTFAVWAACGIFDDKHKLVRAFSRRAGHATSGQYLPSGTSNLRCGTAENWGYRHIVSEHLSQWQSNAAIEGSNWRDLADFAIAVALSDHDRVTYRQSNDTFCFSREIYLVDFRTGKVVAYKYPNVVVAAQSKNVITAFPSSEHCR
jgi:hypothetical protein